MDGARQHEIANALNLDLWTSTIKVPGRIDMRVTPHDKKNFESQVRNIELRGTRLNWELLHEDLGEAIEQERTANEAAQAAAGGFFDSYANYTQMMEFLTQLQATYPSFTYVANQWQQCPRDGWRGLTDALSALSLSFSRVGMCRSIVNVGTTIEGRAINGIVISGNASPNATKPAIVINGCQHAREWISPMTVAYIAQALCTNYTTDPNVKQIVDSFEITVIPIVNADGYVYTQTDRMWRKNRRVNKNSSCIGVDINRNWNYQWATVGSSPLPCSDTYQGPSGFSEPEETSVAKYISSKVQSITNTHTSLTLSLSLSVVIQWRVTRRLD